MPNNNGNSGGGAPFHGNGPHKEEAGEQNANMSPEMLELLELYDLSSHALAEAEARAEEAYAKWQSRKALDDIIGKDTEKFAKQACVAEVAAYHASVRFAHNKPNSEAIQALAWRTALSGLSKLFPNVPRGKLVLLLNYKPEELEDP